MLFGKYVNQFYKKYWYHFVLGIIFLLLVDIIQLFIPQIVGDIVRIIESRPISGDKRWVVESIVEKAK